MKPGRKVKSGTLTIHKIFCAIASFSFSTFIFANPVLDNVASGNVSVQQTQNTTVINQSSQKAIINWNSFNVGKQEAVHFNQSPDGIALNRINPQQGVSQIYGVLTATGKIILVNPAGIYFGPSAYVNVGGLIATTSNISDKNFLSGNYIFDQVSPYANASIINEGTIIAAQNGLIALVGQTITNNGLIQADMGRVTLASGDTFTVDFNGDHLINFSVGSSSRPGQVTNNGALMADGGNITITAQQASGLLDNVINLHGVIQAQSVSENNGEVIISGDPNGGVVDVAANINASGKGAGETGGHVSITGYNILLDSSANIDVSGDAGGGTVNIGGSEHGQGPLPNANAVVMAPGANINASAITNGNGGNVVLWSDNYTNVLGNISARGGELGGSGGFIETSSHNVLNIANALVDTSAANGNMGTWLLDPWDVTISTSAQSGGSFSGGNPNTFTPSATANILNTTLNTDLGTANVIINTTGAGSDVGNISVTAPITWTSNNTLTLNASNNITIGGTIDYSGSASGGLVLNAVTAPAGTIAINGAIRTGTTSSSQLTLNSTGAVTQNASGIISGSGSLIKQGAGTFAASQANTYSGSTTINAGTIQLGSATGLPSTSNIAFANVAGAILDLNNNNLTIQTITGGGSSGGDVHLGSGMLTLANAASNFSYGGAISGTGGITLVSGASGIGTIFTLTGTNNTYSGTTFIDRGTLQAGADNVFSANSSLAMSGSNSSSFGGIATLDENGFSNTVSTLSGINNANFNNLHINGSLTINQLVDTNVQLSYSGNGTLIKTGSGALNMFTSGTVTYTGKWVVNGGTLSFESISLLGTNPASLTPDSVTLSNNGKISIGRGANLPEIWGSNRGVTLGSGGGTIQFENNTLTLDAPITGSGPLTLTSPFGGFSTLSFGGIASNTYTGDTFVNGGTVSINTVNALPSGSALHVNNTDAASTFSIASAGLDITVGSLEGSGGTVSLGSHTLIVGGNNNSTTYSGTITGTGGITKQGTGVFTLSGTTKAYTGTTTISAGTLQIGAANVLPTTTAVILANTAGATLDLNSFNATIGSLSGGGTSGGNVTLGSGTLTTGDNTSTTFGGVMSDTGGGGLTKTGGGTLTLSGANTYTGATTISAGTLQVGNAGTSGNLGSGTITDNAALSFNRSDSVTVSGAIGGTGALTQAGSGTLILTGANNYSGTTTISAGSLQIGNGGTSGSLGSNSVTDNGALLFDRSDVVTIANAINGTGSLTQVGTGTIILTNTNNYSGSTSISAGTLQVGNGSTTGTLGTNAGIINNNGTLAFDRSNAISVANVIGGSGGITQLGTGTLTLTGINTYSGVTSINAGTLSIAADNKLGTAPGVATPGQLVFNGGTLLTTASFSLNSNRGIALTGNAIFNTTAATTLTYGGIIAGSGNLTKSTGTGTLVLSGANTYSGVTSINAGTLSIAADNNLGTAPGVATPGQLVFNGGTLLSTANFSLNSNRGIALTGNGIFNVTAGTTLTYGGVIAGNSTLTKSTGTGTLTLSGANTYTGATTISTGTLQVGNGGTSGNLGAGIITDNAALSFNRSDSVTVSSAIGGTGTLTQAGSGTLILTGTNNYSGITTISAGSLQIGNGGTGGTLGSNSVTNNGALLVDRSNVVTIANAMSGTGSLTQLGTGTTILTGANNYSGSTTISAGILQVGNGGTTGTLGTSAGTISNNGTLVFDRSDAVSVGNVIGGNGGITQLGTGTLTLTGNNTYFGATAVNAGSLIIGNNANLGNTSGITVASSATLELNNALITTPATLTLSGGTLFDIGTSSFAGAIILSANTNDTISTSAGADNVTLNGAINGSSGASQGSLSLTGPGQITLNNTIGATTALNSFTDSIAFLSLGVNGAGITTVNDQTYNDPVNFTANNTTLRSSAGSIFVNNNLTVIGANKNLSLIDPGLTVANNMTINDGSGILILNGGAGSTLTLGNNVSLLSTNTVDLQMDNLIFGSNDFIGSSTAGNTVIAEPVSAGLTIGVAGGIGSLQLTSAFLNDINATKVRIGNSTAGNMNINNSVNTWTPAATFANNGVLTLQTAGSITEGGPIDILSNGASQLAIRNASSVDLTTNAGSGNNIDVLAATGVTGSFTLTANHALDVTSLTDDIGTINGMNTSGTILLNANNNGITLDSSITTTAGGDSIVLAGNLFTNNAGSSALNPGAGRFLVWSYSPTNDTQGGLPSNFTQYDSTFGVTPVTGSGNGFLYVVGNPNPPTPPTPPPPAPASQPNLDIPGIVQGASLLGGGGSAIDSNPNMVTQNIDDITVYVKTLFDKDLDKLKITTNCAQATG